MSVQHGGEVPLHGFRKPLPERPKGELNLRLKIHHCHSLHNNNKQHNIVQSALIHTRHNTDTIHPQSAWQTKTLHNSLKGTWNNFLRWKSANNQQSFYVEKVARRRAVWDVLLTEFLLSHVILWFSENFHSLSLSLLLGGLMFMDCKYQLSLC